MTSAVLPAANVGQASRRGAEALAKAARPAAGLQAGLPQGRRSLGEGGLTNSGGGPQ